MSGRSESNVEHVDNSVDNTRSRTDVLIVGQGLAGSLLAWELKQRGKRVLVIDNGAANSASRVAAGIINPVTGQRMVKINGVDVFLPVCHSYYQQLETFFGKTFYHAKPMLRMFRDDTDLDRFKQRRRQDGYAPYLGEMFLPGMADEPVNDEHGGFVQLHTGYVDIQTLLECIRKYLQESNSYAETEFSQHDLVVSNTEIYWNEYIADTLIFCDGANAVVNPYFCWLPFQPARGDILTLRSSNYHPDHILNDGIWILPLEKPNCRVGATYRWEWVADQPCEEDKQELLDAYNRITGDDSARVVDHKSGVRPTTRDKQAFLGMHPSYSNIGIFNGFGSKGALTIPFYAQHFAKHLMEGSELLDDVDIVRFDASNSAVVTASRIMAQHLEPEDFAIDATAGNGHDTLLLASCVGQEGHVFAFDIQSAALETTRKRLARYGMAGHVTLVEAGHEQMQDHVPEDLKHLVGVIVFNLGYLPGGDHSITTQTPTTQIALTKALNYLKPGGVLIIVCYPDHEGGKEELSMVRAFSRKLPSEIFQVKRFVGGENLETAPQLFEIKLSTRVRYD